MKVCVVQPKYSFDEKDVAVCNQGVLDLLDQCDASLDLIVLPEYSDIPLSEFNQTVCFGKVLGKLKK